MPEPFEVHFGSSDNDVDFITFQGPFTRKPRLDEFLFAEATEVTRGALPGVAGDLDYIEVDYRAEGQDWRQRDYLLQLADGRWLALQAIVTARRAEELLEASDAAVKTWQAWD